MKKYVFSTGFLGSLLLVGALNCYAEQWEQLRLNVPNQNLEANYYDTKSVKTHAKSVYWTEKFVLTELGQKSYTKHLSEYPDCKKNIDKKGPVTYHKIDFEIKEGKFRTIAKRNYNKVNELICTDKEMGTEFDKKWYEIENKSPMSERYYLLVSKHNIGNI